MLTLINSKLIDSESMATSFQGSSVEIKECDGFSVQIIWSGGSGVSTSDTVIVQGSNDGSTFSTIETVALTANASGSIIKNYPYQMCAHMSASYVKSTASAGIITVIVNAKGYDA